MKNQKLRSQLTPILTTICLSLASIQAFAIPYAPGTIIHPIHYKKQPETMFALPSGMTPQQIRHAYGFDLLPAGSPLGQGQTIAIIDAYDDPNIAVDLAMFNKQFNLPPCTRRNGCFRKVYASGKRPEANTGWAGEIALDVEWAHAMAPEAKIVLVEAASANPEDLYQAIQVAVSPQVGATVVSMSWGAPEYQGQTDYDSYFNNPNVTFVASSGDSGTGVMHPASSPYVVAVGGTNLALDINGNYVRETAWSGSSGGVSTVETWPTFQSLLPIPLSNNMRGVPDVSYNADPQSGFSVYNSFVDPGETGGWMVVGGTSAGAPQWAAIVAIANSVIRSNIGGKLNSLLYGLANPASGLYHDVFNDVVVGSNGPCGYFCTAEPGYDYVTGLGTPVIKSLIDEYLIPQFLIPSTQG